MSDTTRQDFEKWFDKRRPLLQPTADARRVEAGYYGSCGLAWETWQAAWTASRQKALQEAAAKVDQKAEGIARVNTYRGRINSASQHAIDMLNDAALLIRSLGGITSNEGERG